MNEIIEKIHLEFDTAVDNLIQISNNYKLSTKKDITTDETYETLSSLGFNQSKIVSNYLKEKETIVKLNSEIDNKQIISKNIDKDVEFYKNLYPFHKFILYSQVINICKKYNLVLGKVNYFNGEIPEKNAKEIASFNYKKYLSDRYMGYYHIGEEGIFTKILNLDVEANRYSSKPKYVLETPSLMICAPLNNFSKDLILVGNEVVKGNYKGKTFEEYKRELRKVEDPIVLFPVVQSNKNQCGFIVISKWGNEANDESLQVGLNN